MSFLIDGVTGQEETNGQGIKGTCEMVKKGQAQYNKIKELSMSRYGDKVMSYTLRDIQSMLPDIEVEEPKATTAAEWLN